MGTLKEIEFGYGPNYKTEYPSIKSIENFKYNGFITETLKGFANYTAEKFIEWTNDPGICKILCSDGVERLIPSCQLHSKYVKLFPKKEKLNCFGKNPTGTLFGIPSKS